MRDPDIGREESDWLTEAEVDQALRCRRERRYRAKLKGTRRRSDPAAAQKRRLAVYARDQANVQAQAALHRIDTGAFNAQGKAPSPIPFSAALRFMDAGFLDELELDCAPSWPRAVIRRELEEANLL